MKTTTLAIVLAATFAGCSKDKPKAKTTPDPTPAPVATKAPEKPVAAVKDNSLVSPGLAISGDIASLCGIKAAASSSAAPKFEYDQYELTQQDRDVLTQIATCLTSGALKGKAVSLIGRADPRGTEEYNMGLGSKRSHSVSQYLARLGVGEPQMHVTTRGALDAKGTDEATWREDRRVDINLAN